MNVSLKRRSARIAAVALLGIAGVASSSVPAHSLTTDGYAIGGRQLTATTTFGTTYNLNNDPLVIHAPSMRASEGCPEVDEDDEDAGSISVTVVHADGTEYDCQTGDYTIR